MQVLALGGPTNGWRLPGSLGTLNQPPQNFEA